MRPTKPLALGLSIATLLATLSLPPSRALGIDESAGAATLDKTYGQLPMSFEKNAGQSRPGVDFVARGSGYSVFLTPGEAVLAMKKQGPPDRTPGAVAKHAEGGATIRMALVSSDPARGAGEDQLPGKANYFLGNDSAKWHRDVPTFAKVRYAGVYPGIDVVYYGNQGRLEYDFMVSPQADPVGSPSRSAPMTLRAHSWLR
jgi:hypothetical protein